MSNTNNEPTEVSLLIPISKHTSPIKNINKTHIYGDFSRLLSSNISTSSTAAAPTDNISMHEKQEVNVDGIKYRRISTL